MPKNYDAKNTGKDGKAHDKGRTNQPQCKTCADSKTVRVSKGRFPSGNHTRQQYDIVTQRCPDCN